MTSDESAVRFGQRQSHSRLRLRPNFQSGQKLDERIRSIVGVVESGLFISRADPVFVADAAGVHHLDSARAHRGNPPILVVMGVSGSGKTTIAEEIAARLGWPFQEGNSLHPEIPMSPSACRHSAHGCRSFAVAAARGRLDRWAARQEAAGHHHVLRAQTNLSPNHHRRPAAGAAGLFARRSRLDCRASLGTPRSFHAGGSCCEARSTRSKNRIRARIR